eukprot:Sro788_g202600.1 n/a (400) ;mRNA; r:39852-41051
MDDLGDRRQNLDMQFLLSPRALDDGDKSELSFGPNDTTYALFRCGPDFRELGRIEARRGYDHSKDLSSFLLRKRGDSNDKESTLAQKLGVERTKARINVYLKYMSKKHETDLGEVNSEGKAYVKSGDHDIAIIASGKGGGMVRLLSYIGKEKHGGDAELLQEVLQWNFGESFVGEYNIGVDASTTRFTLECFLHNIEENGWNEVNFNNMVCAFGGSCKTIDEKIREFKKKQEEKKLPKEERELPSEELREKRLSKYGLEKEENLTGSDKEKGRYNCWCCRKCFKTEAQLKNHMHSKKHKQSWRKCKSAYRQQEELEHTLVGPEVLTPAKAMLPTSAEDEKRIKIASLTAERREMYRHKKILRELISQDKQERKTNGGKLKPKLGVDGYRPTGTFYDTDR